MNVSQEEIQTNPLTRTTARHAVACLSQPTTPVLGFVGSLKALSLSIYIYIYIYGFLWVLYSEPAEMRVLGLEGRVQALSTYGFPKTIPAMAAGNGALKMGVCGPSWCRCDFVVWGLRLMDSQSGVGGGVEGGG